MSDDLILDAIGITRGISSFGIPPNPIFITNLACDGSEVSLLNCSRSAIGFHQCGHSQDAGVQCFGITLFFSLNDAHNSNFEQILTSVQPPITIVSMYV